MSYWYFGQITRQHLVVNFIRIFGRSRRRSPIRRSATIRKLIITTRDNPHDAARLICMVGNTQAHHIKFAQPRSMALKVSDEFTVPIWNVHHDQRHRSGGERFWWSKNKIDPLKVAEQLWNVTNKSETITIHFYGINS